VVSTVGTARVMVAWSVPFASCWQITAAASVSASPVRLVGTSARRSASR
jgi:hypothetical protein